MKAIEETDARKQFDEVVSEAQRQPIVILRREREIAVLVSMAEYDRLRDGTIRGLLELRDEVAREAAAAGLSEERLSELLDSD